MRRPSEKSLDPVVSPLFVGAVHDQLRVYDGQRVGEPRPCPGCGSDDRRKNGFQRRRKTIARLVTEDGFEAVGAKVQQYECRACGRTYQGGLSALFYEECDYARPIVDLCRFHAAEANHGACERILQRRYGLQVDRDTIERYDRRFEDAPVEDDPAEGEAIEVGGVRVSLEFLTFLFDEEGDGDQPFVLTSHTALW